MSDLSEQLADALTLLTEIIGHGKLWHECSRHDMLYTIEKKMSGAQADTQLTTRLRNLSSVVQDSRLFSSIECLSEGLQKSFVLKHITPSLKDLVYSTNDDIQGALAKFVDSSKFGCKETLEKKVSHISKFFSIGLGIRIELKNDMSALKKKLLAYFT
jgi:hypothetical protein